LKICKCSQQKAHLPKGVHSKECTHDLIINLTINKNRVDDAPGEQQAIHLLELIINKNRSAHEQ
jgi:hypothetical protein